MAPEGEGYGKSYKLTQVMSLESASVKAEDYAFENEKVHRMWGSGFKKKLAHQISVACC